MLNRKIEKQIENYLKSDTNKIMIIQGARQIGKSFIINYVAKNTLKDLYPNYIELNLVEDSLGDCLFKDVKNVKDFYFKLGIYAGDKLKDRSNTLIFIDEVQHYPNFLTLLKFLNQDNKYKYICSGSLLGIALFKTTSIPIGAIEIVNMYPLDFEEFLLANGFAISSIEEIKQCLLSKQSLDLSTHNIIMDLFKKYLLVGGLPQAVDCFIKTNNIHSVRKIHEDILNLYSDDAGKYDINNKLKIKSIYSLIPSYLSNKKKRVVLKDISNKENDRYAHYEDSFDYLIQSGITIEVKAISNPKFPLVETAGKNLLKLYLNDVGLLTYVLFKDNATAILNNINSINLGSVYECVVAMELKSHNLNLYYYDNKANGEVDFLYDDYSSLKAVPIEVKSGKDYTVHSAINNMLSKKEYNISSGIVLSNERKIYKEKEINYYPVYYTLVL